MNKDISDRQGEFSRKTKETDIFAHCYLDGTGIADIKTDIGFFDHMLDQLARHSLIDITIKARGDLHIDTHHTVEDCGYVIGQAINNALGDRAGISRYGYSYIPMDETLSRVVLDFSNRPFLQWNVTFSQDKIGGMDIEVFQEWFRAFSQAAGVTLHVENLYGHNNHHIIESCYKALAKALRMAITIDSRLQGQIASTKGSLSGVHATVKS